MLRKVHKTVIVDCIALSLGILFIYAGFNKIANPAFFQLQMKKSPLLIPDMIPAISYVLPITEILLACCLFVGFYRKQSFYISFIVMASFTLYLSSLYIMFSGANLPCSCGGILGKMGYPMHIVFNLIFTVAAGLGVLFSEQNNN